MIRLVIIALAVIFAWMTVLHLMKLVRTREIDWTGISFMIGFVVLAFYLRNVTGIG